jgi:heat-inducible transcriptional repressor
VVIHVRNNLPADINNVGISIGEESKDNKLKNYSIVSTSYSIGDASGKIALIGPKRMDYSKLISLLNYTSELIKGKIL